LSYIRSPSRPFPEKSRWKWVDASEEGVDDNGHLEPRNDGIKVFRNKIVCDLIGTSLL